MAKLVFHDVLGFMADEQLEIGMTIRRYDEAGCCWFEGVVDKVSGWNHEKQQMTSSYVLVVPGYAPSPLAEGQEVEIVSKAELYDRARAKEDEIFTANKPKP